MWLFYNRFCNQALPKEPDFCSLPLGPPHPLGCATGHPWALARGHLPQSLFLSVTVSFYTLSLFLVLPSSILFNSPSLSMPVWFCLQCFPVLQSPYWVPFSLLPCFFFAIYVTLSFPVLPCFSPSSSSSSSSPFSSIYLCYLTSLSIFLPVFLLSFSVSVLSLCLPLTISLSVSLFTCHIFASL